MAQTHEPPSETTLDHTEAEATLRESEERFRATFELTAVGIAHVSSEGRFLRINQKFCDIVGYTHDEMLARTFPEITHPDDLDTDLDNAARLWDGETDIYSREKRYLHKNGEIVWVNLMVSLVRGDSGEPRWAVAVAQDITERKTMEKALTQSEERYRALSGASFEAIFISEKGVCIEQNATAEKMFGFTSAEAIGRSGTEWIVPEDREMVTKNMLSGYEGRYEVTALRKDGSTFPVEIQARMMRYDGRMVRVTALTDHTQHKQAEKALLESERKYRTLLETLPQKIFLKDTNSAYTYCNENYARDLGIRSTEIAGKTDFEFFPRELAEKYRADDKNLIEVGRTLEFDEKYMLNGKTAWVRTVKTPIRDSQGAVVGILGIFWDITEQMRMEEVLRESEEKFKTLVTENEEIVYMIANDGTFLLSEGKGLSKLGLNPGDVVGKSVFELYEDYPQMLDSMGRAFGGETVTTEIDVADQFFRNWYTPYRNPQDEIIGLLGLSVNITAQKNAEEQLRGYQRRLKALAAALTLSEERERRRIALDLHDHVGQSLAFARFQLAAAIKGTTDTDLAAELEEISSSLLHAVQDTRDIMYDLSSPSVDEFGLDAAISEWMDDQIASRHGLKTEFIADDMKTLLDDDTLVIIFRSVRELLTNVVKHARATKVSVRMKIDADTLRVAVEDDGVGFRATGAAGADSGEDGFGLFSIRERMADLGGSLEIESEPGRGCRAVLVFPYPDRDPDSLKREVEV